MASFITAGNATNGLQVSSDNTGILELKSGTGSGTTAVTIGATQNATFAGNVGIGTSSPGQRVQVGNNTSATEMIRFASTLANFDVGMTASGCEVGTGNNQPILFRTNAAERARVTSGGDFLVGTTNTDPTFNRVNGTNIKNAGGILTRSAGGGSDFGISVTSGIHITFYTDNGSARVTAGNIASNGATTSYNGTSDYRLKDNVQPLSNALNRLSKLRPVTWTWKEGYGGTQPECEGFVAHELQAILPIAVTGEKDAIDENGNPVYQGVDTSFLVATLTAAIQEQQQMIETLQAKVAALEGA